MRRSPGDSGNPGIPASRFSCRIGHRFSFGAAHPCKVHVIHLGTDSTSAELSSLMLDAGGPSGATRCHAAQHWPRKAQSFRAGPWIRSPSLHSAVRLAAMTNAHDANSECAVVDLVEDAVVADADAVVVAAAAGAGCSGRCRRHHASRSASASASRTTGSPQPAPANPRRRATRWTPTAAERLDEVRAR